MSTAYDLISHVKNLPPVSQAALRLVSLLDQPTVSNDDVVQVLKYDNVLTAKLLRACNSPFFGFEEPVRSVDQAVLMLGHQQILHIVLTLAFGGAMMTPLPGYAVEANELWHHSLVTATAAELLANEFSEMNIEPSVAFTAGLIHDIGKLVLGQTLTAESQHAIRGLISRGQVSRADAERQVLGTDHAEVGASLLQSWRLPEDIVEAVAHHHAPVLNPSPRISVVTHVANCVAHLVGSAPGWESFAINVDGMVAERFGLSPDKIDSLVINVRDSFERVDQFMAMA